MMEKDKTEKVSQGLGRYLSPLAVWALAFGSAVGWGAFVMPGSVFLPVAGPAGTLIGVGIGALLMLVIGVNYQCLMQRYPDAGGAYSYVKRLCNYDHGYLCAWFLILTYMAIAWANATALAVVGRQLFGGIFSFGPHYTVAGYEVYLGEVGISMLALVCIAALFIASKRMAVRVQTVAAVLLVVGIAVVLYGVMRPHEGAVDTFTPPFSTRNSVVLSVISIVALAPWAFVGFENVSHSVEEFNFPMRRIFLTLVSVILASLFAYVGLVFVASSTCPPGCSNWSDYIAAAGSLDGIKGLPVFYSVKMALGKVGFPLVCLMVLAAIVTGIIGHLLAASRLIYALAQDGIMPKWFGRLNRDGSPYNAFIVMTVISCLIPFAGRTAIGWIVDVTTIGACIAYCYVSYCAAKVARKERNWLVMSTGVFGMAVSLAFILYFLVPTFWVVGAFAEESYFVLAGWSILGFVAFRWVFARDRSHRLGKSTVVWMALLFLIFFASHMWVRQTTHSLTTAVVERISDYYETEFEQTGKLTPDDDLQFLDGQRGIIDSSLTRDNFIQMTLVVFALAIMFAIYSTMSRRERMAAKAKEYFFSTVSHDIRTPLNAIIGYSQMMKLGFKTKEEQQQALDAIIFSGDTLLQLINDILDLSSLEAGKMALELEPTDCDLILKEIAITFNMAATKKGVELRTKLDDMPLLILDQHRIRQIAFNLIGNAVKFTQKGHVEVRATFTSEKGTEFGTFHLEVEDTGVGISEENLQNIAAPYVRLGTKLARNGGTGLGLAICKDLIHAMGGSFDVKSELGKGSTFSVNIPNVRMKEREASDAASDPSTAAAPAPETPPAPPPAPAPAPAAPAPEAAQAVPSADKPATEPVSKGKARLLLVDDSKMNLMVLKALLKKLGDYDIETAPDGKAASERLGEKDKPHFDAVLTDMWMPEMDGVGLASVIRENPELSSLPVYVITADVELQKDFSQKGFDDILLKPVTLDLLKSKCHQLFES